MSLSDTSVTKPKHQRLSKAWKYFRVKNKEKQLASCKICRTVFTYRTNVSNLLKHIKMRHAEALLRESDISDESENEEISNTNFSMSDNEDDECNDDNSEDTKDTETLDSPENKNEEESVCLLCEKTFPDQNSDEMVKHMIEVHNISQIKVIEGNFNLEQEEKKKSRKRSICWDYLTVTDAEAKIAVCNLCNRKLSFKASASNLFKHLRLSHNLMMSRRRRVDNVVTEKPSSVILSFINYLNNEKTVAACVLCQRQLKVHSDLRAIKKHLLEEHPEALLHHKINGDPLFIPKANVDNKEEESEEENMNVEYLEFEDEDKQTRDIKSIFMSKSSFEKKYERPFERRPSYNSRGPNLERHPKTPVHESPVRPQTELPDSLQYFSNYITSLLQELPDKVSKKLQMDFVRQIIEAQISCAEKVKTSSDQIEVTAKNGSVETGDYTATVTESVNGTSTPTDTDINNRMLTIANGIIIRPIISTP